MEENSSSTGTDEERDERSPLIRGGWLRALLLFFCFIFLTFVLQLVSVAVIRGISGLPIASIETALTSGAYPRILLIHQTIAVIGAVFLIWLFRTRVDRKDLPSLGLRMKMGPLAAGLLLGPIMMGICVGILHQLDLIGIRWEGVNGRFLLIHLLLTFAIAMKEELLFRGYLLNNLMRSMKAPLALLITALGFLLLHGLNPNITPTAVLNLFLAGLLLGVTYIHDRQLAFPVGLHLSWNYAQGPIFGFNVSGLSLNKGALFQSWTSGSDLEKAPSYLTGGDFGLEASLLLTALQILLIPLLYWLWKKMQ